MSVNDSSRLKKRVDRNASGKMHTTLFQIFGNGIRENRCRFLIARLKYHLSPGETPDVTVKRAILILNGFDHAAVADCGFYLFAVADDGAVCEQLSYLFFTILSYSVDIKIIKSLPERLTAVQYALPRKSGLKTLQNKQFIELFIVMQRNSPLFIVVLYILWIIQIHPETTQFKLRFSDTTYKYIPIFSPVKPQKKIFSMKN